jgi:hypothetical protein
VSRSFVDLKGLLEQYATSREIAPFPLNESEIIFRPRRQSLLAKSAPDAQSFRVMTLSLNQVRHVVCKVPGIVEHFGSEQPVSALLSLV